MPVVVLVRFIFSLQRERGGCVTIDHQRLVSVPVAASLAIDRRTPKVYEEIHRTCTNDNALAHITGRNGDRNHLYIDLYGTHELTKLKKI
jgi:5,10-methylenetetrahydrofolate reductase